jgi:hypothetical protein
MAHGQAAATGLFVDDLIDVTATDVLGQVVYSNKILPVNGGIYDRVHLEQPTAPGVYLLRLQWAAGSRVFRITVE